MAVVPRPSSLELLISRAQFRPCHAKSFKELFGKLVCFLELFVRLKLVAEAVSGL